MKFIYAVGIFLTISLSASNANYQSQTFNGTGGNYSIQQTQSSYSSNNNVYDNNENNDINMRNQLNIQGGFIDQHANDIKILKEQMQKVQETNGILSQDVFDLKNKLDSKKLYINEIFKQLNNLKINKNLKTFFMGNIAATLLMYCFVYIGGNKQNKTVYEIFKGFALKIGILPFSTMCAFKYFIDGNLSFS